MDIKSRKRIETHTRGVLMGGWGRLEKALLPL
jgi:hypothetical protein